MDRTTVGSLLRTTQAFCLELCEKETLDYGIAYYGSRFPRLAEVNQFREVIVSDAATMGKAFAEAEDWFRSHGLTCMRWAPAEGCDAAILRSFLVERGFREERFSVMHLSHWPEAAAVQADVRVLPARAMRGAFRATFLSIDSRASADDRAMLGDAFLERLDDPQLDMFVAMRGDKPVGRCGLYQVGDIARVIGPDVINGSTNSSPGPSPLPLSLEGRGVQDAGSRTEAVQDVMLRHVLAMAHRLTFRNVCAQVSASEVAEIRLFEQFGFIPDGEIVEFAREGV